MGKGSNTQTQSTFQSSAPNPQAMQAYQDLLNRASGVAGTPYQGFRGEEVAPVNAQQMMGVGTLNQVPGNITAAAAPIGAADIQRYLSPYTQNVVNATEAQFANQNAQQQSQVLGNAAAQGALGGDRSAVAQALTAQQQQLAQAPVIAGLYNQGYGQALGAAEQQQARALQAAQMGIGAGQAQIGAGTLQQQTQQMADTQKRQDYYQQQGYPFQVAQWLAAIDTGVGSQMGGTGWGTGQTQGPTPNTFSQIAGAGLAAGMLFAKDGGRVGLAGGGTPYPEAGQQTWVPTLGITGGKGPPQVQAHAPSAPTQQGLSSDQMKGIGVLGKAFQNTSLGDTVQDYLQDLGSNRGGRVRRYAGGGLADGGLPDDTVDPDTRALGYDFLRGEMRQKYGVPTTSGVGAATPAFAAPEDDDIKNAPLYDDNQGPVRMYGQRPTVGPEQVAKIQRAERGVGSASPTGEEAPATPDEQGAFQHMLKGYGSPLPPGTSEYAGTGTTVPGLGSQQSQDTGDGSLFSKIGLHMTPELRQGLLQAGLAMMAGRHGGPGSFLQNMGEAGMAGVGAYQKSIEATQEHENQLLKQAQQPVIMGPNGPMLNPQWKEMKDYESEMTEAQKAQLALKQQEAAREAAAAPVRYNKQTKQWEENPLAIQVAEDLTKAKSGPGMSEAAIEVSARQAVQGDQSWAKNLGRGAQAGKTLEAVKNRMADILVNEQGLTPAEAGKRIAEANREWGASQIGANAAARTQANREENLNMILKATAAAVPAALEESEKVERYAGLVPLDRIIQNGQIITNDPNLVRFGMANLQLAEHWARAMNPMGVMRESDRDLALKYLNTALSKKTYKEAVMQLQKQITRERDAIREGKPGAAGTGAVTPGASEPAAGASKPQTVIQNGHTYTLQPDGSYK